MSARLRTGSSSPRRDTSSPRDRRTSPHNVEVGITEHPEGESFGLQPLIGIDPHPGSDLDRGFGLTPLLHVIEDLNSFE